MDPTRDSFGVSTARPEAGTAAPSPEQMNALNTKANAICTIGTEKRPATVQPAQDGQQFVDQQLRCGHYDRLNFDYGQTDWTNVL
ncbi:MAG TPA: hypothetical protein VKV32_09335 [Stellaceae bacterium]|nr:hypothetical protein [Stellaceae bacterium]